MRKETEVENAMIEEGRYALAFDPTLELKTPESETPVPHLNLAPLSNVVTRLHNSARRYSEARALADDAGAALNIEQRRELDRLLYTTERTLTRNEGLPKREWFRHQIYAPGFYTGYGVKTLPGVREAIEQREFDAVDTQIAITSEVLTAFADRVNAASAIWEESYGHDRDLKETD